MFLLLALHKNLPSDCQLLLTVLNSELSPFLDNLSLSLPDTREEKAKQDESFHGISSVAIPSARAAQSIRR